MADREKNGEASEDAHKRVDRAASDNAFRVVDDLPGTIPLTVAELDVIESYLGPLLDALLDASRCNEIKTSEGAASSDTEPD